MWKETPSSSRTKRSSSSDPGNTQPSVEAATVPEVVLPGADPAAALPVETVISTTLGERDSKAGTRQYKVVMSCHVVQGDSPQLAGKETADSVREWIRSAGGERGDRKGR